MSNILTKNHKNTSRNYLERMQPEKIYNMKIAKKYGKEYWDGDRKFGYGGFYYLENYHKKTINDLFRKFNLKGKKRILDVGCGKCFLLFDINKKNKNLDLYGIDISRYAKKKSLIPNKKNYLIFDLEKKIKLPYSRNYFDLVISSGTLHNLSLESLIFNLKEIDRISKKSIIMVESYRNESELFNLQCWALTCKSFLSTSDWKYLIGKYSPKSNIEFIFFE